MNEQLKNHLQGMLKQKVRNGIQEEKKRVVAEVFAKEQPKEPKK